MNNKKLVAQPAPQEIFNRTGQIAVEVPVSLAQVDEVAVFTQCCQTIGQFLAVATNDGRAYIIKHLGFEQDSKIITMAGTKPRRYVAMVVLVNPLQAQKGEWVFPNSIPQPPEGKNTATITSQSGEILVFQQGDLGWMRI